MRRKEENFSWLIALAIFSVIIVVSIIISQSDKTAKREYKKLNPVVIDVSGVARTAYSFDDIKELKDGMLVILPRKAEK